MNKVVIVGIILAIIVAIIAVSILLVNHQYNNYTPTSTTTNNGTNAIPNTNTTTSTTTSNMPTNMPTNISYNTFYFLNKTNSTYYYIFVLSYKEYESMTMGLPHAEIIEITLNNQVVGVAKNVVVGNYVLLIGYTSPLNVSIGQKYLTQFTANNAYTSTYWFTYEGNWTGPLP